MTTGKLSFCVLLSCCSLIGSPVLADEPIKFPGGRIAISHDGNNYDKDDYVAAAMNLALLRGTGLHDKLVHFDHSCHLKNKQSQYSEMLKSVQGAVKL